MKKPVTTIATMAALGLALSAQAGILFDGSTDFETIGMDDPYFAGDPAGASIEPDASVEAAVDRPANYPYGTTRDKVLCVESTNAVFRTINAGGSDANLEDGVVYADMLVKGAAYSSTEAMPGSSGVDKLLVFFGPHTENGMTTTNLYVRAQDPSLGDKNYPLTTRAQVSITPDSWYRIVIVALPNEEGADPDEVWPCFRVYLGGFDDDHLCKCGEQDTFRSLIANGEDSGTISSFGFAGSGYVDDFVVSTINPNKVAVTLTWPTSLTSVSYAVGSDTNALTAADGTATIEIDSGDSVTLFGGFGDYVKEVSGSSGTLALPASEIDYYFPRTATAGQDGTAEHPFEIADVDDLNALKDAVASLAAARSLCYVQTADIDMASAGAFAGIGTYAKVPTAGVPFTGTYNGQNYKISNVTRAGGDTQGIFNQVGVGGVIENLVVENMAWDSSVSGEYGLAIVGNAGGGATLRNLTAAGTFGSESKPSTHNIAGIVVRICGGATADVATTVDSCTNNATIYGGYTKLGGICAIAQVQTGFSAGKVVFVNCANNGMLVCKRTSSGVTGNAGIVAYSSAIVELTGCYGNGVITNTDGANTDKDGALVGWQYSGYAFTDKGGNSAPADKKMVAYYGNVANVTGFQYATVENNVATTVLPPLEVGNTYLLEGNVAAGGDAVATLTAVGDSIAFDAALGYTFAGTVGYSGAAGAPTASTVGTVTTYTAGYFPRTATAGQDGTAEHPFEIADLDDLLALQAAVANDTATYQGLSYVQTADIALTDAWEGIGVKGGKDIATTAEYDNGAFTGTYDGGNFTISNFQMENGTDYGALFNSVYGATIKNLKMSFKEDKLCANSSSSGGDTGATFVGVAKASTLQNLTTLADPVATVSASKDMGGIVGYLMAGSTVDSCTNALNVASLKGGRKCGGIAIITQGGTGSAVLRNCKNSGTSAGGAQDGGLVGYLGVATEIDGCENTAAVQLFKFQSGSVTASGVNKGNATVRSSDASVAGLRFATVDGDIATFVADNALAAGNTYKVMATGATATFAFAEAGTISFDTALFTPTYAITAAEGLTLTDATEGTVTTYTAAAPAPAYPTYLADADNTIKGLYDTWAEANGADSESAYEKQFLLGVSPRVEVPDAALHIAAITNNATAGWDIVVECAVENVDLSGTVGTARVANGYLAVSTAADLAGPWTTANLPVTAVENGTVTVNVNPVGDAAFLKVQLSVCEQPAN